MMSLYVHYEKSHYKTYYNPIMTPISPIYLPQTKVSKVMLKSDEICRFFISKEHLYQ